MAMQGRTLTIQFINDDPNGIRIVQGLSLRCDAYIVPRNRLSEASNIIKNNQIGIYFLFDEDKSNVYVGRTGNGIGRLQTHHQKEKFCWSIAIMFLTDKGKLTAYVDELETLSIIRLEKACNEKKVHYVLLNKDKRGRKESSLANLPDIEGIFSDIKFCLAAFDYNIETTSTKENAVDPSIIPVVATRGGIKANGLFNRNEGSITVKAGSEVRLDDDHPANGECVQKKREDFLKAGKIKKIKGKYILQEDVYFEKLSPSAEFVIGGSCNGKTEWKSDGKTLKELFNL
ncbi:DUF4357 domain-containing protein [Fibrobacter sp.]|uniref:DUF4357 domain-containing protein n=1 Tax=Fibrobacter sp. TaxID=35828 RepID=UPI0038704A66